jgi:hypothetical protein
VIVPGGAATGTGRTRRAQATIFGVWQKTGKNLNSANLNFKPADLNCYVKSSSQQT